MFDLESTLVLIGLLHENIELLSVITIACEIPYQLGGQILVISQAIGCPVYESEPEIERGNSF